MKRQIPKTACRNIPVCMREMVNSVLVEVFLYGFVNQTDYITFFINPDHACACVNDFTRWRETVLSNRFIFRFQFIDSYSMQDLFELKRPNSVHYPC
jgi:hypothetical protein